ncbi:MAG: Kae1-associated serine/threonine protein kinase [Candidatus Altiarchaeales archaeon]|nr:Kae1-associated serine/threonine protein kinase [Candidatus Altiarchaeales archaeon]
MDLIAKGAEANLYRQADRLVKNRIKKAYRIKELDEKLRKLRTRHEAKILENAGKAGIKVPRILKVDEKENTIEMEYINGSRMKEVFDESKLGEIADLSKKIGSVIARMHASNIIHNDLTTSNIMLKEGEIYFIDFGLGYSSTRLEDKAMDLVVFKKSLLASHTKNYSTIWKNILEGYKIDSKTEKQMQDIEKRVRYAS